MRCVVVGTSGSGKSTFARELASKARLHYVELDRLHWGSNWTPRPALEFQQSVQRETEGERWVVDGNYSAVREAFWPRATHVVWLNFSRTIVFSRIIRRTFKRAITQEELWHGNRESLRKALLSKQSILLWSFTTYAKNQVKYARLRASPEYADLHWQELRTPWQANTFIRSHAGNA